MNLVWIGNGAVVNLDAIDYVVFEATECQVVFGNGEKLALKDQQFRDFGAYMTENFKTVAKSNRRISHARSPVDA
jgi:hypothetical protein